MPKIDTSIKLHPKVRLVVEKTAADLGTTISWVIEAALVERFKDQLPPGFVPGMPVKEANQ